MKKQKDNQAKTTLKKLKREADQLNKQIAESVKSKTLLRLAPKLKKEAKEVLEQALKQDFDTVIVFGFKNTDKPTTWLSCSASASKIEIIGAIEAAKQHIWNAK